MDSIFFTCLHTCLRVYNILKHIETSDNFGKPFLQQVVMSSHSTLTSLYSTMTSSHHNMTSHRPANADVLHQASYDNGWCTRPGVLWHYINTSFSLFNQNVPKYIAHEMCNNFSAFRPYIVKDTATLCFKGRMILVVLYVRS